MMEKYLTEAIGGTVRHEPRTGGGSQFFVRLKM